MIAVAAAIASLAVANGEIAFTAGQPNGDVYLLAMRPNGTRLHQLTLHFGDSDAAWSRDGSRFAWVRWHGLGCGGPCTEIWTAFAEGSSKHRLTPPHFAARTPAWSPDGTTIVFTHRDPRGPGADLYAIPAAGGTPAQLTNTPAADDQGPAWTPDGRAIVFASYGASQSDLYSIRPDGTGLQRLTRTAHADEQTPTFSPDGRRLAYSRRGKDGDVLVVANADGSSPRVIVRGALFPSWSPDGTRIAFAKETGTRGSVATVRPDGRGLVLLRGNYSRPVGIAWAPRR